MDIGPVRLSDYTVHGVQAVTPLEIRPERRELIQAVKAVNRAELFGEDNEITFTSDNETRKPVTKIVAGIAIRSHKLYVPAGEKRHHAMAESEPLRTGLANAVPLGGPGEPEAVAEAALYLVDPRTRFVTGATLAVDGGITAHLRQT